MAQLTVTRTTPLSADERDALPEGIKAVTDEGEVVARGDLTLPTAELARVCFVLGQAIPGGTLGYAEAAAPLAPSGIDPWKLLDDGDIDGAEQAFEGRELDPEGRDRVRELFRSTDPAEVALAIRIARATNWRSFVTQLRRTVEHGDVNVRRDCARAIGRLAGPSLVPILEKLLSDTSPEVQQAARDALAEINAR